MTSGPGESCTRGRRAALLRAACVAVSAAAAACSSVGRPLPSPETVIARTQAPIQRSEYRLNVGDRVQIKFPYHGRLDQEVPVRPDGKISLEVTGELPAEGLTPRELEARIAEAASRHLRDPAVVVIVKQTGEQRVYVGGEVGKPGFVLVQEGMTPLQAVLAVGGFKDTAQLDSVLYVTPGPSGSFEATRVDLDDVLRNGTPETVRLRGNDVVYVPTTRIANANMFVEKYIRNMLPVESRAGVTAPIP